MISYGMTIIALKLKKKIDLCQKYINITIGLHLAPDQRKETRARAHVYLCVSVCLRACVYIEGVSLIFPCISNEYKIEKRQVHISRCEDINSHPNLFLKMSR